VPAKIAGVSSLELFQVKEVLFSSDGKLIANEVLFRNDDGWDLSIDKALNAVRPCFIETDAVDLLQYINPRRRLTDLEDSAVRKIRRRQISQWLSKLGECTKDCLAVLRARLNKHIEIFAARGSP